MPRVGQALAVLVQVQLEVAWNPSRKQRNVEVLQNHTLRVQRLEMDVWTKFAVRAPASYSTTSTVKTTRISPAVYT